jgi:hypothetical protein
VRVSTQDFQCFHQTTYMVAQTYKFFRVQVDQKFMFGTNAEPVELNGHKINRILLRPNRTGCQSHPVEMFIEAAVPRDKRNQNSELSEISDCSQFWVINPKLVKALECASMTHLLLYPGQLKQTVEHKSQVHKNSSPSPFLPAYPKQSHPVIMREKFRRNCISG